MDGVKLLVEVLIVRGAVLRRLSMFILSWRKQGLVIARATRLENDVGSASRQSAMVFQKDTLPCQLQQQHKMTNEK